MAAISRAQMMKELLPGLNALFGLTYKEYEDESKEVYETESSDRAFEEEVQLSGFNQAPVKAEGSAITYDTAQEVWTARYTHETVAMGFSITEEAIEDNLYDSLSGRYTKALARAMSYTKQIKAAFPLNQGLPNIDNFDSGDGVSMINTSHPRVDGGVNANTPSTPADLNETSLEQAVIDIADFRDQRGLKIATRPRKLIIPPDSTFVATRILDSELRAGTADNDINALRTNGSIPEGWKVNHFLTDSNSWYIITDCPNGMKHFTRSPLTTAMDSDFDTTNSRFRARERYSFGVSDPLGIYGSEGI